MKGTQLLRRALPIVLVAIVMMATTAFAQFSASLSGTVQDSSGAVVAGAAVTLTNNATQVQSAVTTSGSGFYKFNELGPGVYTLNVNAPGFEANTIDHVELAAETARDIDVTVAVGKSTQSVTVNADTIPDLQTADANISSTIGSEAIQRLPSFGADPYELLRLAPGITGDSARGGTGTALFLPNNIGVGQSSEGIYQTENQIQISAAGQPSVNNNFLIDGVSVNSLDHGGAAVVTPNVDSVSQITVVSTSYSAEDGRNSGAQIKTVTKSGGNDIHGTARFQYDEPGLNAYNGYNGADGPFPSPTPPLRVDNQQRYYGGSLGGPIIKDKLFWFISGEALLQHQINYENQYIETPQYRASVAALRGNNIANQILAATGAPLVSAVLTQSCSEPATIGNSNPVNGPVTCQVVPGGIDFGSPYGAEGVYAPGNLTQIGSGLDGVPDVEYVQLASPYNLRGRQYNARLDFNLTPHDLIAGSFYYSKLDNLTDSGTAGARPGDFIPFKPDNIAATLIYIHTFSASLLNEFRANFTRIYDNGIQDAAGSVNYGIPYINIQGLSFGAVTDIQFGVNASSTTPEILAQNTYEVRDTVTKVFGSHTIKIGGEYRPEQNYSNQAGADRPIYSVEGLWNFMNDAPIYEAVNANPNTGGPAITQRYQRDNYFGAFVQHDWKVSPNLTVNMGVRWEYFGPIHNSFPIYLPQLASTPGAELTGSTFNLRNQFYNPEYRDFSPKLGFAWVPKSDPNMVIRGGVGMAYNRLPNALFDNTFQNGPGVASFGFCCGTSTSPYAMGTIVYGLGSTSSPFSYPVNPATAVGTGVNGIPNSTAIQVYGADPHLKTPYTYLYSLEIQRELGHNYVATLGYQGNTSRHEPRLVDQNFIYPTQAGTSPFANGYYQAQTDSEANYNGLNVGLNRRFNRGLTITSVYTWSKALDEISFGAQADAAANQGYPSVNRWNYGPADYDVQNRFTASGLWDIPTYKPDNKIMKLVTGGWQLNGIFTAHTGFPFSPSTYTINGLPALSNPNQISPVRPLSYNGILNFGSCGNDRYVNGSNVPNRLTAAESAALFNGNTGFAGSALGDFDFGIQPYSGYAPPTLTPPALGRNSFRGPCYQDVDLSAAKQFSFSAAGHQPLLRFQCNAYNAFNHTNLSPFTYASSSTLIESNQFGIAQSADAGRVLEFLVRLQF
jgi:hypothetical protein